MPLKIGDSKREDKYHLTCEVKISCSRCFLSVIFFRETLIGLWPLHLPQRSLTFTRLQMSHEERPSVVSNRVFKIRDWNRLEAYRLDSKLRALEAEKQWASTRISLEQREVKKNLLKLRQVKQNRNLSLAERRQSFAAKRSSSDLAFRAETVTLERLGTRRCRSDSEPPEVLNFPPVAAHQRRIGTSAPPGCALPLSWGEEQFKHRSGSHRRGGEGNARPLLRQRSWSTNSNPFQASKGISGTIRERISCATPPVPEELVLRRDREHTTSTRSVCAGTKNEAFPSHMRLRPLRQRSYSTNSAPVNISRAGKDLDCKAVSASWCDKDELPDAKLPDSGQNTSVPGSTMPTRHTRPGDRSCSTTIGPKPRRSPEEECVDA